MSVEQRYRRHQVRRLVLLFTVPGLLLGTASLAAAYTLAELTESPAAAVCRPTTVLAPARKSFDLGIQNSTGIAGQATTVAVGFAKRGFHIVDASNAPSEVIVRASARVYHGKDGLDQALLVQSQVPGAQLFDDGRAGTAVTLVIGDVFSALVPMPPRATPRPTQITVNVYNTTWRSGLASDVARQLKARGFATGKVGNDPLQAYLPSKVALIRYGPDGDLAAAVLKGHLPKATLVKDASLKGTRLDLVLGNKYTALASLADVPPLPAVVTQPPEQVTRPCP